MPGRPHPDPHWIAVFRSRKDPHGVVGSLVAVTDRSVTVETAEGRTTYEPVETAKLRRTLATGGFRPDDRPTVWVHDQWRLIRLPLPGGAGTHLTSTYGAARTSVVSTPSGGARSGA